jgi:predicted DNA binding protein
VIKYALQAGYFEWPREITADELAAELDISRATLLEHLRKGQSKLLADASASASTGSDRSRVPEPSTPAV